MPMSLRGRLSVMVFSAAMGAVWAEPAGAETLADAIALAYESNPTLQAARASQRAVDENFVQARSGWRPTLGLTGRATWNEIQTPRLGRGRDLDGDGVPDSFSGAGVIRSNSGRLGVNFSQPLWTGGRVAANVSEAQAEVLAGRENLRRTEAQVLTSVIQFYMDVRRDQETVRIREQNVRVLTRQREEAQARFDVGEITRTDVAQSASRLAQAEATLNSARSQLAVTRAAYAAAVGHDPGELAPPPELTHLLPEGPDEAFSLAEQFNPQLRAQQFNEQASLARLANARAGRMPQVSANASVTHSGPIDPFMPRETFGRGITGSVNITVPLFSGGLTLSRVRAAAERNNADKINVEGTRRSVLQDVTQFWSQLITARGNIVSAEEQVRAASIAAEGTIEEQRVGLRTTIDVLNAEQELRVAELNRVNTRRDEYVAGANVLALMGRLEAKNLIPTVPQYDPAANSRRLRITWGWVPWEESISIIDRLLTPWPSLNPRVKPAETPIGSGLQQPMPEAYEPLES